MKTKLVGILVCTLFIATALPAVNSIDENNVVYPVYEFTVENECGCPSTNGYGLGHIPLPDWVERTELPEPTEALLVDLDWRNNGGDYTTSAKNQGNCGSCWAFTAIGALESAVEIANSNPGMNPDLSEQYPLSCTGPQPGCPNDCQVGGNAYWAFWYMGTAAPQNGGLPESCFPYQGIDANGCDFYGCGYSPVLCSAKCASWQSQLVQTITGYGFNDWSGGLTPAMIKAQLANGPVCLSMDIFTDFNPGPGGSPSFDGNGVYRWDGVSAAVGGHAVLCVGYEDSLGAWICKNSWGAGWGNMQGFFRIAYGQCNIEMDMSWVTFTQAGSDNPPTAAYTWIDRDGGGSGTIIDFDASGSSDDNGITKYEWDWTNDGSYDYTGGPTASYDYGDCNTYNCKLRVTDTISQTNTVTHPVQATGCGGNNPPTTPSKPNGPTTGVPGVPYRYTTSATDPDAGDQIKYGWDFDNDGIVDPGHWTSFYASGATCNVDITFGGAGTYYLSVIAEDNYGAQSTFSPALTVVITSGANNPPTVSITSPLNGATVSGIIPIQGSAGDSDGTVTQVRVKIDSGGSWWTASGTTIWSTNFDTNIVSDGAHTIYAQSMDNLGAYSTMDSVTVTVNNAGANNPPNQPTTPTGQTASCKVNTPYPYSTSATDSDPGDKVKYGWEWTGDGVVDKWDDNSGNYYTSGTPISTQITWTTGQTTYSLKVIAEDLQGAQSPWSLPLSVTTPRNRAINTPLLNFLEQYPILYQLLQRFLRL